jgi:alanyl-tRNA synthetase
MSTYDRLDEQKQFACRVIADHARATAFSIADGILPGNEGRNYVIRKIMRRAIYQGRHTLGFEGKFFHKVTNFVVDQMGEAYPELEAHRDFIDKMVRLEEERFGSTLTVGLSKLGLGIAKLEDFLRPQGKLNRKIGFKAILEELDKQPQANKQELSTTVHKDVDRKYVEGMRLEAEHYQYIVPFFDTFGVPPDLIRVVLEERGFLIDEDTFNENFARALRELQQTIAVEKADAKSKANAVYANVVGRIRSLFRGYETTRVDDAKVLALVLGDQEVQQLNEGDEGEVVLDQTPFYAESGGQVGDVGTIINPPAHAGGTALVAHVLDTYSPAQGLIVHKVKIDKGSIKVGDTVTAEVDVEKRDATRRNHTATHLVHAALREVLGAHVKQAGSIVAPNYLRFDFTHYQQMTADEVKEVERLVNEQVLRNVKVDTDVMPVEEAMRSGAMALFGEKYSGMMRVLTVPGFSKELCGGTHVRATGDIGVFKITSDESIASGVRRIRAITGIDAYERFREDEMLIDEAVASLRTSRAELPNVIGKLQDELKKARREAEELKLKIASGAIGSAASNGDEARDIAGVKVLAKEASGLDAAGMRQLSDTLLDRIRSGVVVLGRTNDGKVSLIVRTSDDLTKKVPAGQVIKELAPIIGGRGGGKADMAEGGGSQPEKLNEALQASYGVIEKMLAS